MYGFAASKEWVIGICGSDMRGFGLRCGQDEVQRKLTFVVCAQVFMRCHCGRKLLVRELVVASGPFWRCR